MADKIVIGELARGVVMACIGGQLTLTKDQEAIRGGWLQEVDGDTALQELFLLRLSAAAYSLQTFFVTSAQEELREASFLCVHNMLIGSGDKRIQENPNAFIDVMNQRYSQYIEAIQTPDEPGWRKMLNVGNIFAKACREEKDIQVSMFGSIQFGGCMVAVKAFLRPAMDLDGGDIITLEP